MGESYVKCPKCGFENLPGSVYCSKCGAKLRLLSAECERRSVALLTLTGTAYMLILLATNVIVQKLALLALLSMASAVAGVYACYSLRSSRAGGRLALASAALSSILGLLVTGYLFYLGLYIRGAFGPAWVIYAASLWEVWRCKRG